MRSEKFDDDDDDDNNNNNNNFQQCPFSGPDPVPPALVFPTVSKQPQNVCPQRQQQQQQPATKNVESLHTRFPVAMEPLFCVR